MPLRLIFMGTPEFAVPTLLALADHGHEIVAVYTREPKPAKRGMKLQPTPVEQAARQLGIPVLTPKTLRTPEAEAEFRSHNADGAVVVAYGMILPQNILDAVPLGCFNLHASLLPKYRGASPITAAILEGDAETGVSLMRMELGLDTGPVIATTSTPIRPEDTTESLTERLATIGAELAVNELARHIPVAISLALQDEKEATIVRPLIKADGWLNWLESAGALERRVRAMWSWPRAWTTVGDELLQIHASRMSIKGREREVGSVFTDGGRIFVQCGQDALELITVQPQGKRPMPAHAWYTGRRSTDELVLGRVGAPVLPPPLIQPVVGGLKGSSS